MPTLDELIAQALLEDDGPAYHDPFPGFPPPAIQEPLEERAQHFSHGGGFGERAADGLANVQSPGQHGAAGDVFLGNLLASAAQTYGRGQLRQRDERQGAEAALREDARFRNERNARATIAARQEKSTATGREGARADKLEERTYQEGKAKAAKSHRISSAVAKALGDPTLAGTPVTPEQYLDFKRRADEATKPATSRDQRMVSVKDPKTGKSVFMPENEIRGMEPGTGGDRPKPPAMTEREHLVADIGTLKQIGDIRAAFKPELVGPRRGRTGGVAEFAGIGKTEGQSTFRGRLAGLRNQLLKLRSGGAVTEGEAQRLLEELPTVNDPAEGFVDKLDAFENLYRSIAQSRRELMSGTGVDISRIPPLPRPPLSSFDRK